MTSALTDLHSVLTDTRYNACTARRETQRQFMLTNMLITTSYRRRRLRLRDACTAGGVARNIAGCIVGAATPLRKCAAAAAAARAAAQGHAFGHGPGPCPRRGEDRGRRGAPSRAAAQRGRQVLQAPSVLTSTWSLMPLQGCQLGFGSRRAHYSQAAWHQAVRLLCFPGPLL